MNELMKHLVFNLRQKVTEENGSKLYSLIRILTTSEAHI